MTRALVVAGLAIVVAAPLADAHVTVNPGEAPKGGFAKLAFRVPNERDDAGTTAVEVNLPQDHPIANVSVRPKEGWTYQVETRQLDEPLGGDEGDGPTEVVSKITWTGGVIQPGEFDEFEVSVGPLPEDADQILFPTLQTYESGPDPVVRWIDEPLPGGEEPESPAPLLTLVDAEDGGSDDEAEPAADGEPAADSGGVTVENVATQDDVDSANLLGIIGIVVGALGLLAGGFALFRRRSA
ncbi:MAG: YcnI family protein [Acidimicrobiales bacterium]